jgi:hypothetical protein
VVPAHFLVRVPEVVRGDLDGDDLVGDFSGSQGVAVVPVEHLVDSRPRYFSGDSIRLAELGVTSVASWAIIDRSVHSSLGEILPCLLIPTVRLQLAILVVVPVSALSLEVAFSEVEDREDDLLHRPGFML